MKRSFHGDDLRAFVRIAECGALSKAADRFGVPKSTLSRALSRLELAVGAAVFDRKGGRLQLTDAGASLLPHAQVVAEALAAAEAAAEERDGSVEGVIRVDAPHLFANRIIAPNLPRFLKDYPRLQVALDISPKPAGAHAPEADVMIRIGPIEDRSLVARKIGESRLRLCVAADLAATLGSEAADEIARSIAQMKPHCATQAVWRWSAAEGIFSSVAIADPDVRYAMMRSGAGWAWVPAFLASDDVAAGAVRDVTVGGASAPIDIQALFSPFARSSGKVQAFLGFLESTVAKVAGLHVSR